MNFLKISDGRPDRGDLHRGDGDHLGEFYFYPG